MKRLVTALLVATAAPAAAQGVPLKALNPPALPTPNGYSHIMVAPAGRRAVISGQVAMDSTGRIVGAGDFRAQTVQVFENLRRALASIGATFDDVIGLNTYVTDFSQLAVLREVRARYLPKERPPTSTAVQVVALFRPELMIEVSAEVALPEGKP